MLTIVLTVVGGVVLFILGMYFGPRIVQALFGD